MPKIARRNDEPVDFEREERGVRPKANSIAASL
jgi:hypothetical protein